MIISVPDIFPDKVYSRIVSLVPSQTELLHDLGLESEVIGITKFCVHPATWHKNKTRIGGTKHVNLPLIHQLKPDLIIANKEENVREQVEELAANYDVYVTDVNNLTDAIDMIHTIGSLVGKVNMASQIATKIEINFTSLLDKVSLKRKIKTAYLIWNNPIMAAGGHTFINDMMQYCGLQNIFSLRDRYPQITSRDLAGCELILLSSEPYPFKEKHSREIESQLPGVKIALVDGEMFSWYGSRLLKASSYFEELHLELVHRVFS